MNNTATNSCKELFNSYPSLSLKKVCDTLGLCYQYALKASKQPKAGEQYDPSATNYEAVDAIIAKKGIKLCDTDWSAVAATVKVFEPVNRPEDFELGVEFKLRKDPTVYRVMLTTATHIVFMDVCDTQPRVMNWDTFQHQSPRIFA